jgi:hypothetical protein
MAKAKKCKTCGGTKKELYNVSQSTVLERPCPDCVKPKKK